MSGVLCDSWGFVCLVCCVTAVFFCVFVVIFLSYFKTLSLLIQNFIVLLYMYFYPHCRFASQYFVVLLKHTT